MNWPLCAVGGEADMFHPFNWTKNNLNCQMFGLAPSQNAIAKRTGTIFGEDKLKYASNIVFSNGEFDPYSAFGIKKVQNPSLAVINIEGASHCSDLSPGSSGPNVNQARNLER